MGEGEAVGDLGRKLERPAQGERSAREDVLQRVTVDVLEDDERVPFGDTAVDDRGEVEVAQLRRRAGLAAKLLYMLLVAVLEDLQVDVAL